MTVVYLMRADVITTVLVGLLFHPGHQHIPLASFFSTPCCAGRQTDSLIQVARAIHALRKEQLDMRTFGAHHFVLAQ